MKFYSLVLSVLLAGFSVHAQQSYPVNVSRTDEARQFHVVSSVLATPELKFPLYTGSDVAYTPTNGTGIYLAYGKSDSDPAMTFLYGSIVGSTGVIQVASNDFPIPVRGWYAALVLTSSVSDISIRGNVTVRRSPEISSFGVLSTTYALNGSSFGPFTGSFDSWPFVQEGSIGALVTNAVTNAGLTAAAWASYDASQDINVASNNLNYVGSLQFTGTTGTAGTMSWNADEETVDLIQNGATLQIGQEIHWHVRADGVNITKGQVVYASGAVGNSGRMKVKPYIANGSIPAYLIVGIATEDIDSNTDGKVTHFGKVRGIPVPYAEGSVLYPSPTVEGGLTTTRPTGTNVSTEIAFVITSNAANGTIAVRIHPHDANEALSASAISNSSLVGQTEFVALSNSFQTAINLANGTLTANSAAILANQNLIISNGVAITSNDTDIASLQGYTNRAASALSSSVWASADSTTNYMNRVTQNATNAGLQSQITAQIGAVSNNVRGGYYGSFTQDVVIGKGATRGTGQESRGLVFRGLEAVDGDENLTFNYYPLANNDLLYFTGQDSVEHLLMSNGNIRVERLTNSLDSVYIRNGGAVSNNVRGGYYGSFTQDVVIGKGATRGTGQESRGLVFRGLEAVDGDENLTFNYYPLANNDLLYFTGQDSVEHLLMSNGNIRVERLTNDLDAVYLRSGASVSATNAIASISVTGAVVGGVTFSGSGITQTDTNFSWAGYLTTSAWATADSTTNYQKRTESIQQGGDITGRWFAADNTIGAYGYYSFVGGGYGNSSTGVNAFVGGGNGNIAGGTASAVGGGLNNNAYGSYATIGGGNGNVAGIVSVVAGGIANNASGYSSAIGGGTANMAQGDYATIPGGYNNTATTNAFAAGIGAKATNSGSFVWSGPGTTNATFGSRGDNTFNVRAVGEVYFLSQKFFVQDTNGLTIASFGTETSIISGKLIGDASGLTNFPSTLRTIAAETSYNTNNTKAYTWASMTGTQVLNYGSINLVGSTQIVIGVDYPTGTNKVWFNGVLNAVP